MRNQTARAACAAAALSLLALSGCDQIDPMTRPYVWVPSDVNPHNVAAMAVNPADLVHGRESGNRRAVQESDAVDRLWAGRPAGLLSTTGGPSTASAPAAAPPAGGS
jgi:type IV pilus biogenesis protein CpaD/CtpE